jgi:hypothetical protein
MVLKPEFIRWKDDVVEELLAPRMWQSCVVANVEGEVSVPYMHLRGGTHSWNHLITITPPPPQC